MSFWRGLALVVLLSGLSACQRGPAPLRVCADPNDLPFSDKARGGFENRIIELVAKDLGRPVQYEWWAQRRGAVRETVGAGKCDLWPGVATGVERLATTRPYYRSGYTFVTRVGDHLEGLTLDDPRLRRLRLGVQLIGDDGANTPPADALSRRGIVANVQGFTVYGDYRKAQPAGEIIDAVADRRIDVALAWGPLAGARARQSPVPLRVDLITPWLDQNRWPLAFDISVGVRKEDPALLAQIDAALQRRRAEVRGILAGYGVPLE